MENMNRLNEVPLADIGHDELKTIQDMESQLGDRYYLIAFKKEE